MTPAPRVAIIARLIVSRDALAEFRAFETAAAAIMRGHGGRIEQTVVLDASDSSPTLTEVHIVTFPNASAYAGYRDDPALAQLQPVRARAVVSTQVEIGVEGPGYGN